MEEESKKAGLKLNIQKTKIMASAPITLWQVDGETMETVSDFIFLGSKIIVDGDYSHEIKTLVSWKKSYDQPRQHIKKERHYSADKSPSSLNYGFSSSHVWMWELVHKKGFLWAPKNWCFTVVLEKTFESPKDSARRWTQSILKEISAEYSLEGLMLKLKLQYFGHLMQRSDSLGKKSDAGKDWRQQEKGATENKMIREHHWLSGHDFEQTLGDGGAQRNNSLYPGTYLPGLYVCIYTQWISIFVSLPLHKRQ